MKLMIAQVSPRNLTDQSTTFEGKRWRNTSASAQTVEPPYHLASFYPINPSCHCPEPKPSTTLYQCLEEIQLQTEAILRKAIRPKLLHSRVVDFLQLRHFPLHQMDPVQRVFALIVQVIVVVRGPSFHY